MEVVLTSVHLLCLVDLSHCQAWCNYCVGRWTDMDTLYLETFLLFRFVFVGQKCGGAWLSHSAPTLRDHYAVAELEGDWFLLTTVYQETEQCLSISVRRSVLLHCLVELVTLWFIQYKNPPFSWYFVVWPRDLHCWYDHLVCLFVYLFVLFLSLNWWYGYYLCISMVIIWCHEFCFW